MKFPDVTIVTSCYYFHNEFKTRTKTEIKDSINIILQLPVYLVIYTDSIFYSIIQKKRQELGLEDQTKIINMPFDTLWAAQYLSQVVSNREKYHPTKDERNCPSTHCIQCNKFDFVLQVMDENPFETSKFGWLDGFVGKNGKFRIYQGDDYVDKFVSTLNNIGDNYRIMILNVNDKEFKKEIHKKEYYKKYRYVVCGGFFTCGKEKGIPILNRLKELFVQTTNLGYGHGDEMLYLEVLDEFYDTIDRTYGDYHYILNNFIEPTFNLTYIYKNIIYNYLRFDYIKECNKCCETVLEANKNKIMQSKGTNLLYNKLCDIYIKTCDPTSN